MSKPRIGIFDFACCEGCQLQIVNLEEDLLGLLGLVEPVVWREAMAETSDAFDIAIVEGSVVREEDAARLREIREQARVLIALGACATLGGVNKIRNPMDHGEVTRAVYGTHADDPHLAAGPARSVAEVVKVDYRVEGCPIDGSELVRLVQDLLTGRTPRVPHHPVCVECKLRENVCRYELGEVCLGPLTRAGCGARCPSNGFWCFGCRGLVDDANIEAARTVMAQYGKSEADLEDLLRLFNQESEVGHGRHA